MIRYLLPTLLLTASPALATTLPGPYSAEVVSVYDGDTFTANVMIWLGQSVRTSVRVLGIDTPEIRGKCDQEKALAQAAKEFAIHQLQSGPVTLHNVKADKYGGRVLAEVKTGGVDLAEAMIAAGFARPYDGKAREGWCEVGN